MKQSAVFKERQRSRDGIRFLKAYKHCADLELILTYICIFFSLTFFIIGMVFSIIKFTAKNDGIIVWLENAQPIISLISGLYLILQIFFLFFASEFGKNKVSIMEYYDCFVYKIKSNPMITRPISDIQIEEWAEQIKTTDREFAQNYFLKEDRVYETVFSNQVKTVNKMYGLLNFALARFFSYVWGSVIFGLLLLSVILGTKLTFVSIMLSFFIPSLSVISMISNSFLKCLGQKKAAHSCLNAIKRLNTKGVNAKLGVSSSDNRNLQDAIFQQRLALMNIPNFLSKIYDERYAKRENRKTIRFSKSELEEIDNRTELVSSIPKKTLKKATIKSTPKPVATHANAPVHVEKIEVKEETKKVIREPEKQVAKKEVKPIETKKAPNYKNNGIKKDTQSLVAKPKVETKKEPDTKPNVVANNNTISKKTETPKTLDKKPKSANSDKTNNNVKKTTPTAEVKPKVETKKETDTKPKDTATKETKPQNTKKADTKPNIAANNNTKAKKVEAPKALNKKPAPVKNDEKSSVSKQQKTTPTKRDDSVKPKVDSKSSVSKPEVKPKTEAKTPTKKTETKK